MNRAKHIVFDGNFYAPLKTVPYAVPGKNIECHPSIEAFLQLEGTCNYFLNGSKIRVSDGDICLVFPWIPHQNGFDLEDSACEQLWLMQEGKTFFRIRHELNSQYSIIRRGKIPAEYHMLFLRLARNFQNDSDPEPLKAFFKLFELESRRELHHLSNNKSDIAETVKLYITSRNGANCSMHELEKYTGFCRSHISHTFRQECGITIGEYINVIRLEYTRHALAAGQKQKEIAGALGFSSPAAFWQWYRKFRSDNSGK